MPLWKCKNGDKSICNNFLVQIATTSLASKPFFWQTGGALAFHARGCGFDPHRVSYMLPFDNNLL